MNRNDEWRKTKFSKEIEKTWFCTLYLSSCSTLCLPDVMYELWAHQSKRSQFDRSTTKWNATQFRQTTTTDGEINERMVTRTVMNAHENEMNRMEWHGMAWRWMNESERTKQKNKQFCEDGWSAVFCHSSVDTPRLESSRTDVCSLRWLRTAWNHRRRMKSRTLSCSDFAEMRNGIGHTMRMGTDESSWAQQ